MKKILIIKLSALGDFIFATGLFLMARKEYPEAQIDLLTGSKFVAMAQQMGIFQNIHIDDRASLDPRAWYRICKKIIADGNYDAIFDFQGVSRTKVRYRYLSQLFACKKLNWLIGGGEALPHAEHIAPTLEFCHGEGKNFHLLPERYMLLLPGCSATNQYKRWPKEKYAQLANIMAGKGISTLVLGTSDEAEELEYITQACPMAVNFMNKASILDIPDIAKRSLCVVGNDTGPTHIACYVHTPSVVVFCQRTSHAAQKIDNVINLVEEDIGDIRVEAVMESLQKLCPEL